LAYFVIFSSIWDWNCSWSFFIISAFLTLSIEVLSLIGIGIRLIGTQWLKPYTRIRIHNKQEVHKSKGTS
jgi:hypothetical protein